MSDEAKFKELLDNHYTWPAEYTFKFIVKVDQVATVLNYFKDDVKIDKRPSKKGNYISISITKTVTSSDEIISIYHQLESVEGIIKL